MPVLTRLLRLCSSALGASHPRFSVQPVRRGCDISLGCVRELRELHGSVRCPAVRRGSNQRLSPSFLPLFSAFFSLRVLHSVAAQVQPPIRAAVGHGRALESAVRRVRREAEAARGELELLCGTIASGPGKRGGKKKGGKGDPAASRPAPVGRASSLLPPAPGPTRDRRPRAPPQA